MCYIFRWYIASTKRQAQDKLSWIVMMMKHSPAQGIQASNRVGGDRGQYGSKYLVGAARAPAGGFSAKMASKVSFAASRTLTEPRAETDTHARTKIGINHGNTENLPLVVRFHLRGRANAGCTLCSNFHPKPEAHSYRHIIATTPSIISPTSLPPPQQQKKTAAFSSLDGTLQFEYFIYQCCIFIFHLR